MPRKQRVEAPGLFFHITSHAVEGINLYNGDDERELFLFLVDRVVAELELVVHTWCEMTNHFHLLVETPKANLADCMHVLNGEYAMWVNRLRGRRGHVFDARYKPILIERDAHFKEVVRYVVLNPVRARICERAEDWRWSAHRALAGLEFAPKFLTMSTVLSAFGNTPDAAREAYCKFVAEGSPFSSLEGILALTPPPK